MAFVPLTRELEAATSLLDLARRLGSVCLANERLLTSLYTGNETRKQREKMEWEVAAIDDGEWQPAPHRGFAHVLEQQDLAVTAKHLSQHNPLEHLAFVRGLMRPLTVLFEQIEERIPLDCGLPIPFATRPFNESFESATPFQPGLASRGLLHGCGCEFFRHAATGSVPVILDFRHRERLDEITWSEARRLPSVATLHPFLGEGHLDFNMVGTKIFDVRPKRWSPEEVLEWLRSVRGHQIAVLPELSLPSPDALAVSIAAAPADYPPLIVAGSAHVQRSGATGTIRSNESHVYLDGQLVNVHRKIHPLQTRTLGAHRFARGISEGITNEPKELLVLSGQHTRLAVVICADLNDAQIPMLLEAAGVNLLLVPALTYSPGAFNGAICGLASRCQAVCVVVNASLDGAAAAGSEKRGATPIVGGAHDPPFLVLASVPRPEPEEQSRSYPHPSHPARPPRGTFDPNRKLSQAWKLA